MDVFKKIIEVHNGGVEETLQWDGAGGFMLQGNFVELGQSVETETTHAMAQRNFMTWAEMAATEEGFKVVSIDQEAVDKIMEGVTGWPGLQLSTR